MFSTTTAISLASAPVGRGQLLIVGSSKPQFKSTKKHTHKRPKKHGSDRRRTACDAYAPLPPPPPEYTTISE
jgi:hypothetical protein